MVDLIMACSFSAVMACGALTLLALAIAILRDALN